MAKYTVNYTCGHTESINLVGPEKERKNRINRMEQGECRTCAAERMTKAAAANGLPALTGSEKQVAWALSIRTAKLAEMKAAADKHTVGIAKVRENLQDAEFVAAAIAKTGKTIEEITAECEKGMKNSQAIIDKYEAAKTETSAAWWIDHR